MKMDTWSLNLHLVIWTSTSLLCVFTHVTVRDSELKLCEEDERVCVTDLRDCGPQPPSSVQETLNMSCTYDMSQRSMTCEWSQESNSHAQSDVSLIFNSEDIIHSCQGLFNPAALLNITARTKNYMTGREIWSYPHTVFLFDAIKPSQPVLIVVGTTEDSVVVSWRSSSDVSCRLRYRVNHTHTWTQASVHAHQGQTLIYTIKDLLPSTVYRASVACRGESRIWSNWSSDVSVKTLDRVPSRPPQVCYRAQKTDSAGTFLLHLMWKNLDFSDGGGHVLGYQVTYKPMKEQQDRVIQNVTELMVLLVVEEGNWSVTVSAFNTAGYGPAAHLSIDTKRQNTLPSVRHLWVSSNFPAVKGLVIRWEMPAASSLPVSHFTVQWHSDTHSFTSHWITVDNKTSTIIEDVNPDESYTISVFPIYQQQCGPPQLLPASLQQGALKEAVRLKVVGVTKTTMTVAWAWQNKKSQIRVNRYSLMLRKDSETQTLSLWPDQSQHTFFSLKHNTEYSLLLLADNISRITISARTDFDEIPVVATATPLLLLAVTVVIISILSRTVYKSYFFPPVSSPRGSTTGQWLMDANHPKTAERKILNIEDFQVTDVLGQKNVIVVTLNSQDSSDEDLHKDTPLLSTSHLILKLSTLKLDSQYVLDAPADMEHQLGFLQSDYSVKCHRPEGVSEESQEVNIVLLHQTHEANSWFPQTERDSSVKCPFPEFTVNTNSPCVHQMPCEADYVANSSFPDVETMSGQTHCSYLVCEADYIGNSCSTAKIADEDSSSDFNNAC